MKQLYICEKCGKMFDNYADASNCEDSHLEPFGFCEFVQPTYKEGGELPLTLTVSFRDRTLDGGCKYVHATYKLCKCLTPAENAEIARQRLLADEEWNRRHEEWKARREAEEAAEEVAKAAAEAEATEQETIPA